MKLSHFPLCEICDEMRKNLYSRNFMQYTLNFFLTVKPDVFPEKAFAILLYKFMLNILQAESFITDVDDNASD